MPPEKIKRNRKVLAADLSPPRAYSKRAGQNSPFALRKNMPASCHRFRFQYSTATQRGTESRILSRGRGISPQNIAKKTGRLPLTPTLKKSAAILSSLRIKSAAGTKASSLPSPSTRLGRTSTRLGRSKVTATYTPQIRTGKTRRRKSPCAATKSGSTTRQYPTTASIPLPRT